MKRAITLRRYADAKPFEAPNGVVTVTIDPESGMPANAQCPMQAPEVFIAGTEPVGTCPLHGGKGDRTTVSGWDMPSTGEPRIRHRPAATFSALPPRRDNGNRAIRRRPQATGQQPPRGHSPKKKGFFGKLKDVFR